MKKIYGKNKLSNSDRWIENAEKRQISALLLYKMAGKTLHLWFAKQQTSTCLYDIGETKHGK